MGKSILIAEDEQVLRQSLAQLLEGEGYHVTQAADGRAALAQCLRQGFDLVISDIRMPEMDGLTLLPQLRQVLPETPVIIITAFGTVDSAVSAMRAGACDYLLKPVSFDDLLLKVQRALEFADLKQTRQVVTQQLAADCTFHNLIGASPGMTRLFEMVRKLSAVKSSVLIIGESGTGKELFARAIHYNGPDAEKPFVAVNCGAIPEALIESELFGHRRGSFTGAIRDKVGYFEAASGGTLFLDEISTLPLPVQSTLLRVLEERSVVRVGDTQPRAVDLRVIAASNQDLERMAARKEFREDLLYRLNVVTMLLPPLRQRRQDIPALVSHFVEKYTRQMNKKVPGVTNTAMRAMLLHEWRGNVRELENVIERAVIFAEGRPIDAEDLPFAAGVLGPAYAAGAGTAEAGTAGAAEDPEDLREAMRQFERQHILGTLKNHGYDKVAAAQHLGIGLSSLYRKLDELNIPKSLGETPAASPG